MCRPRPDLGDPAPAACTPAFLFTLRRLSPLSERWGSDRGQPVDRYYIEQSLARHCDDIYGTALEVKDASYTHRFGRGVARSDVLDIDPATRRRR